MRAVVRYQRLQLVNFEQFYETKHKQKLTLIPVADDLFGKDCDKYDL